MPRKLSRLTDSICPGLSLSFDPLWTNVDLEALSSEGALCSYMSRMKRKLGHTDKCRVYQYILLIGALRKQNLTPRCEPLLAILHDTAPRFLLSSCASTGEFVRLLQLATECLDPKLTRIILSVWVHRIQARQLSPVSAILVADDLGYRNFLAAALYEYLLIVEDKLANTQSRLLDDNTVSPLSHAQNLRVCEGYYALEACVVDLCNLPLSFSSGPKCRSHSECLSTWDSRWSSRIRKVPRGVSAIDVLGRLRVVHDTLSKDRSLNTFMTEDCRRLALSAVLKKRERIARNLYHYFDL